MSGGAVLGAIGLGLAVLAAAGSSKASTPPAPPGGGGGGGGGGGHGGGTIPGGFSGIQVVPPSIDLPPLEGMGGRAFCETVLPARPTLERDALILAAVRARWMRPITWLPVDASRGGHQCTILVSDDVVAIGTPWDFVRVNVRHPTASLIARELGALLPTTRTSDLAWEAAQVRLRPHTFPPDSRMAWTERMIAHHDAIEAERENRMGLVRTCGKDFVVSNLLIGRPERCCIFGWHDQFGPRKSPGGAPIIQPIALAHEVQFTDYSQTVQLVSRTCFVDGDERDLGEVLRDPELAQLVSDEGPIQLLEHPALEPLVAA